MLRVKPPDQRIAEIAVAWREQHDPTTKTQLEVRHATAFALRDGATLEDGTGICRVKSDKIKKTAAIRLGPFDGFPINQFVRTGFRMTSRNIPTLQALAHCPMAKTIRLVSTSWSRSATKSFK